MKRRQALTKPYLELTTASLLAQQRGGDVPRGLPRGSLLLIAPEGNPKVQACLAQIARCFAALGGAAFVQRIKAEEL